MLVEHSIPVSKVVIYPPGSDGVCSDTGYSIVECPVTKANLLRQVDDQGNTIDGYTFSGVWLEELTGTVLILPEVVVRDSGKEDWSLLTGDAQYCQDVNAEEGKKKLLYGKRDNWTVRSSNDEDKLILQNQPFVIDCHLYQAVSDSKFELLFGDNTWKLSFLPDVAPVLYEKVSDVWKQRGRFWQMEMPVLSTKSDSRLSIYIFVVRGRILFSFDGERWLMYSGDAPITLKEGTIQLEMTQLSGWVARNAIEFSTSPTDNYVSSQLFKLGWTPTNAAELRMQKLDVSQRDSAGTVSLALTDNTPTSQFRYKATLVSDDGKLSPELYLVEVTFPPAITYSVPSGSEILNVLSIQETWPEDMEDWNTTITLWNPGNVYGSTIKQMQVIEWWCGYLTPTGPNWAKRGIGYVVDMARGNTTDGQETLELTVKPRTRKIKDYVAIDSAWPTFDGRPIEFAFSESLLRMGIPYQHQRIYRTDTGTFATWAVEGNGNDTDWRNWLLSGAATGHILQNPDPTKPLWRPTFGQNGWDWMQFLVENYYNWVVLADIDGNIVVGPKAADINYTYIFEEGQYTQIDSRTNPDEIRNMFLFAGRDEYGGVIGVYYMDWPSIVSDPNVDNFIGYMKPVVGAFEVQTTIEILTLILDTYIREFNPRKVYINLETSGANTPPTLFPGDVIHLASTNERLRVKSLSTSLGEELWTATISGEYLGVFE